MDNLDEATTQQSPEENGENSATNVELATTFTIAQAAQELGISKGYLYRIVPGLTEKLGEHLIKDGRSLHLDREGIKIIEGTLTRRKTTTEVALSRKAAPNLIAQPAEAAEIAINNDVKNAMMMAIDEVIKKIEESKTSDAQQDDYEDDYQDEYDMLSDDIMDTLSSTSNYMFDRVFSAKDELIDMLKRQLDERDATIVGLKSQIEILTQMLISK